MAAFVARKPPQSGNQRLISPFAEQPPRLLAVPFALVAEELNELRQAMAEASSLAGIIADLQRNTDRLRAPLAAELRTVKAAIARLLPLLEGTPDP